MFKPAPAVAPELAKLAVNTIKFLAVDGVEKANSGHPGLPMGAADLAFVLFSRYLKFNPQDPHWADRDRFILSAGHGSMLIYTMLHLAGYDLPLSELQNFRQWDSKTPGHPEAHMTPGVECTTGPLGQGIANAVGMALGAKMAEARFPGLLSHNTWVILGDGCMQEGICHEAASMAGHLGLNNLKAIYDDNKITLDGDLSESMSEDVKKRFDAYGWLTISIDGHDHEQIAKAYDEALAETKRPVLILARTHIGNGAPNKHDTHKVHGEPLGAKEMEATRKNLGWPLDKTFYVPDEVRALWQSRIEELKGVYNAWKKHEGEWKSANPEAAALYAKIHDKSIPADLLDQLAAAAPKELDATRSLAGVVLQKAAELVPSLVGGDADLSGSTKTALKGSDKVLPGAFGGKNLRFGIREHAMGAVANGLSLYGMFIPFTATFLTFSDYMRPTIRLAALTKNNAIHVFTHDSIFLGEDGPTHQPVEHVASLRMIPNVDVWRPGDPIECAAAWAAAITRQDGPTEIILSRQKVDPYGATPKASDAAKGGYIVAKEEGGAPEVTIMATGSEVGLAVQVANALKADGRRVRVVSFPCLEVFARQDAAYQASVLPKEGKRVSIEAGITLGWRALVGNDGLTIGIDHYGASAPAKILAEKFGLTAPQITAKVRGIL
jgi:transketolase